MKLKTLMISVAGGAWLAMAASASFAESTMEKIVRTGQMTIAVQTQGPPVSFINKDGLRTGLAIELARMMADDMEVELIIQDYDWKGLIPALSSGKADFIAADMTPTAKRNAEQKAIVASHPQLNITPGVLTQFNPGAANELKKYDNRIKNLLAKKPAEQGGRARVEPAKHQPETRRLHR